MLELNTYNGLKAIVKNNKIKIFDSNILLEELNYEGNNKNFGEKVLFVIYKS